MGKTVSKVSKLKAFARLMRPQQWFKSLSILLGASIVVYEQGMQTIFYFNILLVLLAVSLLSSSVYVFNDISDVEKDRLHPLKKKRPIASGELSVKESIVFGLALLAVSLLLFYYLKHLLFFFGLLIILNNFVYSFKPLRAKRLPVLDVLIPALDFSLRVLIGWYALTDRLIYSSAILFPLLIAGFLLSCKRLAEYHFLGLKAAKVRKVFKHYNTRKLYLMINTYFALAILFYFFFTSLLNNFLFLLSPWFFIQMQWYKSFLKEKRSVVKNPEDVFLKKKIFTISGLLFCASFLLIVLFF